MPLWFSFGRNKRKIRWNIRIVAINTQNSPIIRLLSIYRTLFIKQTYRIKTRAPYSSSRIRNQSSILLKMGVEYGFLCNVNFKRYIKMKKNLLLRTLLLCALPFGLQAQIPDDTKPTV